jgi:hypothetical protein
MAGAPYVELNYWVLGYTEGDQAPKGFAGWSYTQEELEELARADRRKRIVKQIRELERQLAAERAWAEMEQNQRYQEVSDEIADLERRKKALKLN